MRKDIIPAPASSISAHGNFKMEVHPVTPLDKIGELFQRWATEGR
jgi:hypothetical protein